MKKNLIRPEELKKTLNSQETYIELAKARGLISAEKGGFILETEHYLILNPGIEIEHFYTPPYYRFTSLETAQNFFDLFLRGKVRCGVGIYQEVSKSRKEFSKELIKTVV